jgi:uncharacterized protein (DUF488 family)
MKLPFFTIGHSDRSLEVFAELLIQAGVTLVVDIRKMPRSRTHPQFNEDALPASLTSFGISYEHIAALGGLRKKAPFISREINDFWTNRSFHNYADYALSPEFREGAQLIDDGRKRRGAMMCSEAVWWRCHRRIVADYLIAGGEEVFHIMGGGRVEPAQLTRGAIVQPDGTVIYPGAVDEKVLAIHDD